MNIIKCKNNHYFDNDKYASCPHCGVEINGKNDTEKEKSKSKFSFHKHTKDKDIVISEMNKESGTTFILEEDNNAKKTTEEVYAEQGEKKKVETLGLYDEVPVREVITDNTGKTTGYFSINVGKNPKAKRTELCVGWLICIKGALFGNVFEIVSGKNAIGRNEGSMVCLDGDLSVSREQHAFIVYEPQNREFFLLPGNSSGLTYINAEVVLTPQKMKKNDEITFGDGKYLFIPLCCEEFSWEEYIVSGD